MDWEAWWAAVHGVAKSQTQLRDFTFTFHFHALEKEMAPHSSVLAWRIPGTGEPHGLPSMGSHRVGHDWSDLGAAAATYPSNCLKSQVNEQLSSFSMGRWVAAAMFFPLFGDLSPITYAITTMEEEDSFTAPAPVWAFNTSFINCPQSSLPRPNIQITLKNDEEWIGRKT